MAEHFPLLVPDTDETDGLLKVCAPYNGKLLATVDTASSAAVDTALNTAHRLFQDKRQWLPAEQRIAILEDSAAIMQARFEELALLAASEGGKPLIDSRVEVARAIDGMKLCVEHLRTDAGEAIPMRLNPASRRRLAFTSKEPIGVVVAVSAFNHPLNLIVHQVAPAIATGCPVIVKPAEDTPLSCFRLIEIFREAGLPAAWCQAMTVNDLNVASQLVTDSRVAFFSFIGSAKVGWMLRSKLAPGTRCALEHGGAAPVIVTEDADLQQAVPLLTKGGLYHAGQVCVSVQRVFVHESKARELADALAVSASQLIVGDPTVEQTEIGPLIRHTEVDRIEQWVNEAREAGAEVLTGGKRLSDSCYACTVLYDPPADARVSQQEIFGPVINVYPYRSMDDAIERANALPFAFQASVFGKDIDRIMAAINNLDAAAVMVNDHTAFRVDWMPFAGLKQSGLGVGGIPHTMQDMQVDKLIVIHSSGL